MHISHTCKCMLQTVGVFKNTEGICTFITQYKNCCSLVCDPAAICRDITTGLDYRRAEQLYDVLRGRRNAAVLTITCFII